MRLKERHNSGTGPDRTYGENKEIPNLQLSTSNKNAISRLKYRLINIEGMRADCAVKFVKYEIARLQRLEN